jgi:hypothetical protein
MTQEQASPKSEAPQPSPGRRERSSAANESEDNFSPRPDRQNRTRLIEAAGLRQQAVPGRRPLFGR